MTNAADAVTWTDYLQAGGEAIGIHISNSQALTSPGPCGAAAANTACTHYFIRDHLGSVAIVTGDAGCSFAATANNSASCIVERDSFDPWGRKRNASTWAELPIAPTSANTVTTRGYTGHEDVNDINLVNMNARFYDPTTGRFMSTDPLVGLSNVEGVSPYSYVLDNPLASTDPSGMVCFTEYAFDDCPDDSLNPDEYNYFFNAPPGWSQADQPGTTVCIADACSSTSPLQWTPDANSASSPDANSDIFPGDGNSGFSYPGGIIPSGSGPGYTGGGGSSNSGGAGAGSGGTAGGTTVTVPYQQGGMWPFDQFSPVDPNNWATQGARAFGLAGLAVGGTTGMFGGGVGGTLVAPGFGTVGGAISGEAYGALAGGSLGTAAGAGLGWGLGIVFNSIQGDGTEAEISLGNTVGAADSAVLSGHGALVVGDFSPVFQVPEGTSVTVWTSLGESISDSLGNVIETGQDVSLNDFPEAEGAQTYLPGSFMPDYTLFPLEGLNIMGNPITVEGPTSLSNFVSPGMGNVNWAACCEIVPP